MNKNKKVAPRTKKSSRAQSVNSRSTSGKKTVYKDKLLQMVKETPTRYWNDSCALTELKYAIDRGATGATTNPVIVKTVLSKEIDSYKSVIKKAIKDKKTATEDDITWHMIEYAAKAGAKLLEKSFDARKGKGRISIQTNTKYYRDADRLLAQALHFHTLGKNMQVKMPATAAGITAIEEATYHGISINATVSFTVPQALAVAQAVERGLNRRVKAKKSIANINPVCTIMVGRLDDWLKIVCARDGIVVDPECLEWAGVAAMKRAYEIYKEKGYRTTLLSAAYRNHYQWSEFIGGDIIETIPYGWQVKFNKSKIKVTPRMEHPVDAHIISQLLTRVPDFKKAYEPKGLTPARFDEYGATVRTLLQFANGYDELVQLIRSFMIKEG